VVTELQFVAIAAFLIWCLASSLCGVFNPDSDEAARLVWREHGPAGWGKWREVHFGTTAADRRVLSQPEPMLDPTACAGLLDTVRHQPTHPESDAIQFAVIRMSPDQSQATVVYVSNQVDVASIAAKPSLKANAE
jgi:hypothetical protein